MIAAGANATLALVNEGGELSLELRAQLQSLGAAIVYEATAQTLDVAALKSSGARVVVVNLGGDNDESLDRVYALLDSSEFEIVINDTEATAKVASADQARWARHLAAKILRRPEIILPPIPAGTQAVPTFAEHWAAQVPVADLPGINLDSAELMSLDAVFGESRPPASNETNAAAAKASEHSIDTSVPTGLTTSDEVTLAFELPADAELSSGSDVATEHAVELESSVHESRGNDRPTLEIPISQELLDAADAADMAMPKAGQVAPPDTDDDSSLRLALESFDASVAAINVSDENLHDFDAMFAREPEPQSEPLHQGAQAVRVITEVQATVMADSALTNEPKSATSTSAPAAPNWSLEPVVEGESPSPSAKPDANEFGIEKIPAHVYLAPHVEAETEGDSSGLPSTFDFELVPIESEIAPTATKHSYDTGSDLRPHEKVPLKRTADNPIVKKD